MKSDTGTDPKMEYFKYYTYSGTKKYSHKQLITDAYNYSKEVLTSKKKKRHYFKY